MEIVRRSIQHDSIDSDKAKDYTYTQRSETRTRRADGSIEEVKSTSVEV